MMKPVIALVGRPNVGKSTLFNRLTRTRDALVSDMPGLTRDRNYGVGRMGDRPYIIIDTGGLSGEVDDIDTLMAKQSLCAAEEADLILFVVDGRAGLTPAEAIVLSLLRPMGKPICLVVNKTEGLEGELASAEFQALGIKETYTISASHGHGVPAFIDAILSRFPRVETSHEEDADKGIKVAIVGRPNVGKSTLVNRILGEKRVLAFDQPGTTRDSIFIPFERDDQKYVLIDTAGVRRRSRVKEVIEKFSVIKTLNAIEDSDVAILVLDARLGISDQDAKILGYVLDSGRALVIAINKWDGMDSAEKKAIKKELDRKLSFVAFAEQYFISARHGTGVTDLFRAMARAYQSATKKMSTPKLTALLEDALRRHSPPLVRGRRIKLRYAHQGGHVPPVIVIHGNQTDSVPEAYRKYLENHFRSKLDMVGTPIRVVFKTSDNPFEKETSRISDTSKRKSLPKTKQDYKAAKSSVKRPKGAPKSPDESVLNAAKSAPKPKPKPKSAKTASKPTKARAKPVKGPARPTKGSAKPAKGSAKPSKGSAKPAKGSSRPAKGPSKPTKGRGR